MSRAAHSPSASCTIAFGFPLRDFTTPGTALTVEIEGRRYDVTVRPLPFILEPSPKFAPTPLVGEERVSDAEPQWLTVKVASGKD